MIRGLCLFRNRRMDTDRGTLPESLRNAQEKIDRLQQI